jgi:hypothetical protein
MEQPDDSILIKQYLLSLRLGSDGFNISVFDESGMLLSSKKITRSLYSLSSDEIRNAIAPETQLNYSSVRIICESDIYTFIPAQVFKKEEAADLLHFQFKPDKNDQILYNRIPQWNTMNVFSIPRTVHIALSGLFPEVPVEHHLSYFLSECIKFRSDSSVYIEVRGNVMDVVVILNGILQLINSYSFVTPEDFTYYTLNLFDKLPLDTENCRVVLYNADKRPELQKTLELYLEVIKGER